MAVPTFQSQVYVEYSETSAVTDVSSVITAVRTHLVTNIGWTEPSANLFKSPVDAYGRWFDILLTRDAASTLEMRLRDASGVTICTREAQIDTAGTVVRIYASEFYCFIEFDRPSSTDEHLFAGMLDQSPDTQAAHNVYTYGNGTRTSAGSADGQFSTAGYYFMLDNGSASVTTRARHSMDSGSAGVPQLTGSGAYLYFPVKLRAQIAGAAQRWAGQMYGAYFCDSSLAFQTEKTIPIDDSTTKTFKVTSLATATNSRLMMRKS